MGTPVSQPVVPAQPDTISYSIADLDLFVSYTRESYLAAFGVQAPAWDSTRLTKTWFDTTVNTSSASNVAVYEIAGQDSSGNWGLQQMVIPAAEAATVNLTGSVTYPAYVIAPTQAASGGAVINPLYLSIQSDAQALMEQIGGTGLFDEGARVYVPVIYPADESRRMWDFTLNGNVVNAGALIASMNANGVGYPGQWQTQNGGPVWVPDPPAPTGLDDTRPPRPMPVRNLLPNEQLQAGLMGVSVVRTDLQEQQEEAEGQFTADDRATLQQIFQMVSKLS
ncbi:MAG TPA: hypothetical protein VMG40_08055 [Bryobacteraceae bacterium]|nr:hypothetical protein [Bryobacteraceae bacterium]